MEFVLLGLIVLSFPIIAIVALVKTVGLSDQLRFKTGSFLGRLLVIGLPLWLDSDRRGIARFPSCPIAR